jgi:hypothetical protein
MFFHIKSFKNRIKSLIKTKYKRKLTYKIIYIFNIINQYEQL